LGKGISSILGIKDVEMRIGVRDEFNEASLKPGYKVFINCPQTAIQTDQLWIKGGVLWEGDGQPVARFEKFDYCLVRYDLLTQRPYTTLSFYKHWNDIKKLVWAGNQKEARALFLTMGGQLAVSPDVTTKHRYNLIRLLKANLEREIQEYSLPPESDTGGKEPSTSRGAGPNDLGKNSLKSVPMNGQSAEVSPEVSESVRDLVAQWDSIMGARKEKGRNSELTEEDIKLQLQALPKLRGTEIEPQELMKLLTFATLKSGGAH
jgi:hypothetical protein